MKATAIILAGGKSSRFGSDKSLLMWNNQLIMKTLVDSCRTFADEILIVSNQENKFGIQGTKELRDIYPEMGPLGGLHAGLNAATHERVFLTACDMPLLNTELAKKILYQLTAYEAVVPCCEGRFHPMFTAFRRTPALFVADHMLSQGERKMLMLIKKLSTCYWECSVEEEQAFYNMNYLEDYRRLIGDYGKEIKI